MRILIITQRWYPDTFGGSEHVAAEQALRLAARGHTVTVLTQRARDALPPYEVVDHPSPGPMAIGPPSPAGRGPFRSREGEAREGEGSLYIYRYGSEAKFSRIAGKSRTDMAEVPKLIHRLCGQATNRSDLATKAFFDVAILHHPFAAYGFFRSGVRGLLLNAISPAIAWKRLRLCRNSSTDTAYMPRNFFFASLASKRFRHESAFGNRPLLGKKKIGQ